MHPRAWTATAALVAFVTLAPCGAQAAPERGRAWCGTRSDGARDAVLAHREERARRGGERRTASAAAAQDVGEIAVLQDEGDLALLRRFFDLGGAGLEWRPGDAYTVSRVDRPVGSVAGDVLALGDDDARAVSLPFAFPFFGRTYTRAFVNSDGNLTFEERDDASTARSLGRLVSGPPRIAPLLADFDPSAGGSVAFAASADSVSVTWIDVPQYDQQDKNTFQVVLWRDGRIDFAYDKAVSAAIDEGVVGLAPGAGAGEILTADLSAAAALAGAGAIAESFRDSDALDAVAVARKFYETHPDDYQQLVVYTSRRVIERGTFAYERTVRNADAGTGQGAFDYGPSYGSPARLESFVDMDAWSKYSDNLDEILLDEDSTLSVLAHEVGHRWLAYARYADGAARSEDLLGRQQAHWSFFAHTSGSHMEGNDIEDLGGGRFRTRRSSLRYSPLDQYLMGLRAPDEVPPFFVVRGPSGTDVDPTRSPQSNVSFAGTRRDVNVNDVIAALGPRNPPAGTARAPFRQAFVFVVVAGDALEAAALARLERIRAAFPAFFARSTDGRGSLVNTLR
jgi:hypothetical protein